jgi:uncharacterized protein (DUF1778 family)
MGTFASHPRTSNSKKARLEARISVEQKKLFLQAANIQGTSVSDFVVMSAQVAARNVIQEQHLMKLTARDTEILVNALLNPTEPNEKLRAAAERFKKTSL